MYGIETIVKLNRQVDTGTTLDNEEGVELTKLTVESSKNTTAVTGEDNGT